MKRLLKQLVVLVLTAQLAPGVGYAQRQRTMQTSAADAVLKALEKPAVAAAVRAEVIRQIKSKAPLGLVYGRFVYAVDLRPAYSNPSVRDAILGGSPGLSASDLMNPSLSFGLVYFPPQLIGNLGANLGDLKNLAGVKGLQNTMTGMGALGTVLIIIGATVVGGIVVNEGSKWAFDRLADYTVQQVLTEDTDKDGESDVTDKDDDGDGAKDDEECCPKDASRKIVGGGCEGCDVNGVVFTRSGSDRVLSSVSRTFAAARQLQPGTLSADMKIVMVR